MIRKIKWKLYSKIHLYWWNLLILWTKKHKKQWLLESVSPNQPYLNCTLPWRKKKSALFITKIQAKLFGSFAKKASWYITSDLGSSVQILKRGSFVSQKIDNFSFVTEMSTYVLKICDLLSETFRHQINFHIWGNICIPQDICTVEHTISWPTRYKPES